MKKKKFIRQATLMFLDLMEMERNNKQRRNGSDLLASSAPDRRMVMGKFVQGIHMLCIVTVNYRSSGKVIKSNNAKRRT